MLKRLYEILTRPLFGTGVIPKDAAVDPALFPEEEFPVYCPKCDYLLRGLPDGKCPECGRPFQRGQLLVRQYARETSYRLLKRTRLGKLAKWSLIAFIVLWVVSSLAGGVLMLLIRAQHPLIWSSGSPLYRIQVASAAFIGMELAAFMLSAAALVFNITLVKRGWKKRRAVRAAIIQKLEEAETRAG